MKSQEQRFTMNIELLEIDHIHVNVKNRTEAEKWYESILGLKRKKSTEFWASDGGPLTLQNESDSVHLALFERESVQNTVVAFKVSAEALLLWIGHLTENKIDVSPVDHEISWSIYFRDPDGNPYEITTYAYSEFIELQGNNAQ
jgi:catechol-2,3-dioxygenase